MAKKQKRKVSQAARITPSAGVAPAASNPSLASARPAASSGLRPASSADFNPDYTYARQDLKRVGIMAASFIGLLIVLSFVLPLFIK